MTMRQADRFVPEIGECELQKMPRCVNRGGAAGRTGRRFSFKSIVIMTCSVTTPHGTHSPLSVSFESISGVFSLCVQNWTNYSKYFNIEPCRMNV